MRKLAVLALIVFTACRTIGFSKRNGGYSEVAPSVANDMLIDTTQVVVIDVRPAEAYQGPSGHIAGALSTPFDSIEKLLPELLPYQNQTVLVYGQTSTDGALAAKLLSVAGFRNVVHMEGGIEAWIAHGYRTVNAR